MNATQLRKLKALFVNREKSRLSRCLTVFLVAFAALVLSLLLRQPLAAFFSFMAMSVAVILMNHAVWTTLSRSMSSRTRPDARNDKGPMP